MSSLYTAFRCLARLWLLFAVVFILTFVFGIWGFHLQQTDKQPADQQLTANSLSTNIYLVVLLFAMNCGEVGKNVNWQLDVARWLGFVLWLFTVGSILLKLFGQRVMTLFVATCSLPSPCPGHVIVAGLGKPESERDRLVERLRAQGKNVVVVEPDAEHPGLEACREAGAVCLIGSPFEPTMLRKAQVTRAETILALCEEDRKNITLLTLAASLVDVGEKSTPTEDENPFTKPKPENLSCVVQVSEPRMLEVLRRHDLHRDPNDHLHLRLFNMHEMVARAMLRECLIGPEMMDLNKVLLLGTGAKGRLAEALVMRLVKDRFVDVEPGQQVRPIEIHVCDREASSWIKCLKGSFDPEMERVCQMKEDVRDADRCGFRAPEARKDLVAAHFDAVFICMSCESDALAQAVQLRDVLQTPLVPIVLRVHEETTGFGQLLERKNAGGLGSKIHVVGSHDRVFDIVASMNPMVEILAQVLHQDYLLLTQRKLREAEARGDRDEVVKIGNKAAFKPWRCLIDEFAEYRESNRLLAQRLSDHLVVPPTSDHKNGRRFRLVFCPSEVIDPLNSFVLTKDEIDLLAQQEHRMWYDAMWERGWRPGSGKDPHSSDPVLKLNPNLVPWEKLDKDMKEYDRNIIKRIPYVFAKADYKVVQVP